MIINQLSVTDFQVFQGRHDLDLSPRKKYNAKRPVILFGGLNGAGKTTTLTAVRLALYGRQILGKSASNKAYDIYLEESIHRARDSIVQANSASIEIKFTYAKLGELKHYTVSRSWMKTGSKLVEKLKVFEDDKELEELSNEQCQGFLNELVPVGVSDLFFFDGEKIAELAEDVNGSALGDAIKKLLGIDTLETLNADLGIYLRNKSKEVDSGNSQKAISELEDTLAIQQQSAEEELKHISQLKIEIEEFRTKIKHCENKLSSQGGAWATSREAELEKQTVLTAEKKAISSQLQEVLAGAYPFSIAGSLATRLAEQLEAEATQRKQAHTSKLVRTQLDSLKVRVKQDYDKSSAKEIIALVENEFSALSTFETISAHLHDLSEKDHMGVNTTLSESSLDRSKAKALSTRLSEIEEELDKAGQNIARAPLESQLKPLVEEITGMQKKLGDLEAAKSQHVDQYKRLLRDQIETMKKLDKLSQASFESIGSQAAIDYATSSRELLKKFSREMAKRKIADLESEFARSFQRLARKDDVKMSAEIDPQNFAVTLYSADGLPIDKNRLSAGEKQIYAIAILEALARTSDRKLPIIIDTPLGRLDSKHRANLVNNYFPRASHQVIILSTDTEVDEEFYGELSPYISHAYKLNYDPSSGSTHPSEEYFWKPLLQESA